MTPELHPEERIRILQDRIHHLNVAVSQPIEDRLEAIYTARIALRKAEKELANGPR